MSNNEQGRPFQSRGSKLALALVVVILLIAIVAIIVGVVTRANEAEGVDPTPSSTASEGSPSDPTDESVCGLGGYETTSSLDEAPADEWALVGTVAAPDDRDGAGPGRVDGDGFRSCYAHTAEGALYAAVNYMAMTTDSTLTARLIDAIAPGPGRDVLEAKGPTADGTPGARLQVVGYAIPAYTGSTATVDVVYNLSTGQLVSAPLKLEWSEGDWKLVLTDDGELPLAVAELSNLGGYTPWSGA